MDEPNETTPSEAPATNPEPKKRGRGRPKGSGVKPKKPKGVFKMRGERGPNFAGRGSSFPFDAQAKEAYLDLLRQNGLPATSARKAGFNPRTIGVHRRQDSDFEAAEQEALQEYRESIEAEVKRRAMDGIDIPIVYLGQVVGYERRYSDALLMFHAKRHIPEYRDKSSVDATVTAQVEMKKLDMSELDAEQRDLVKQLIDRQTALKN